MKMHTVRLGEMTIDRVVYMEGPFAALDFLLPDANVDELMESGGEWLAPRFYEPATGRAVMSFHSILVRTPHHTILVDSCIGDDKERPTLPPWHRKRGPYLSNLRAHGVEPEDVDFVMCTHMHSDHVGWNTRLANGRWVPTFPNAKYVFARKEFEYWEGENSLAKHEGREAELNNGSWFDSVLPVIEAGLHVVVDSDHQIDDSLWFEPAPGHTSGAVTFHAQHGGDHAIIVGDMFHTPAQLINPALSSRFCMDPEMSTRTRLATIDRYADTDTVLLTAHFPTPTAGRIVPHGDGFKLDFNE